MRYYILAGEASGDLHASNLMKALKEEDPQADFRCWGGDLMQQQGGVLVKHYRDLAFMGFLEVAEHLPQILRNFRFCEHDLLQYQPDILILVDYPGFNLRMAKFAHLHKIRVFYYISPQLWAWRSSRVKKIKRWVDKMFVILPFEKDFYGKFGYPVDFVGHPLLDALHDRLERSSREQFLLQNNLGEKPIIALLPGSRKMEIRKMLAEMVKVSMDFPGYQFVIAGAPSIDASFYQALTQGTSVGFVTNQTYDLLNHSRAALVTSGTATLETALMNLPQVVCYKGNYLSFLIAKRLIKVRFISLVNLIMERPLVTELIQQEMNRVRIGEELKKITEDEKVRSEMTAGYEEMKSKLGGPGASQRTARLIRKYLLPVLIFLVTTIPGWGQASRQKELIDAGILKAKMMDYKAALADFDEAIRIDSTEAEPFYNRGIVFSEMKDYPSAISDFTRVIRIRPAYPEPYFNRALAKDYQNDHRDAIRDYSKALGLKPDYPEALHNRGLAWFDLGNYTEAMNDFTRALQYRPQFAEALYNRGLCWFNTNDYPAAITDFDAAISVDPLQYEYYSGRGAALAASMQYEKAKDDFLTALRLNPGDTDTRKNLALAFLYLKNYEEAEKWYTAVLNDFPEDQDALTNRGVARNYLGNLKGACDDWTAAIRAGSEKAVTYQSRYCQ